MRVSTAFIPEPNAVVLDFGRSTIEQLIECEELAATLFRLVDLLHEIPEPGLGKDSVLRKKTHPVDLRRRVFGRWCSTTDDLVLVHARLQRWICLEGLSHTC